MAEQASLDSIQETNVDLNDAGLQAQQEMLSASQALSDEPRPVTCCLTPSSPYGVGEMLQAAKIEVSALDNYVAQIHGSVRVCTEKPCGAKVLAARRYLSNSSDPEQKPAKTSSPKIEQAKRSIQNIIDLNQSIQAALSVPDDQLPQYTPISRRMNSNEPVEICCNQKIQRQRNIIPFAEKYIKQLGYQPDSEEAQTILKETVEFYSTSPALAETLRNLVESLPES